MVLESQSSWSRAETWTVAGPQYSPEHPAGLHARRGQDTRRRGHPTRPELHDSPYLYDAQPRRLVAVMGRFLRWLTIRGWAFGGAAASFGIALLIQPPYPVAGTGWPVAILFGISALLLGAVACWPEQLYLRAWAVTAMVTACGWRGWGVLLLSHDPLERRAVACIVWLLVAYWTFLLGIVTWKPAREQRG